MEGLDSVLSVAAVSHGVGSLKLRATTRSQSEPAARRRPAYRRTSAQAEEYLSPTASKASLRLPQQQPPISLPPHTSNAAEHAGAHGGVSKAPCLVINLVQKVLAAQGQAARSVVAILGVVWRLASLA